MQTRILLIRPVYRCSIRPSLLTVDRENHLLFKTRCPPVHRSSSSRREIDSRSNVADTSLEQSGQVSHGPVYRRADASHSPESTMGPGRLRLFYGNGSLQVGRSPLSCGGAATAPSKFVTDYIPRKAHYFPSRYREYLLVIFYFF